MGLFDKFLDAVRMSDDYEEDDDFFDEEDEAEEEPKPKRRLFGKRSAAPAEDPFDDDVDEEDDIPAPSRSESSKVGSLTFTKPASQKVTPMRRRNSGSLGSMEVCVIKPVRVEDYREIADTLLSNCTVVLNLEGLDIELAQRIIDFSSGSCYAINGGLQKVSSYIFILTPANVEISGDIQDLLNGAMPAMRNSV